MKIIKNSEELAKLVDEKKDLHLENEDVRIEFQLSEGEIRDVYCKDLFLMKDDQTFDFYGGDFCGGNFYGRHFNGGNFKGGNFYGENFRGGDFIGGDFYGSNFNGWSFTGRKVSYWAFFNCYDSIKCESIKSRRKPHAEPICLDGKLEIIEPYKTEKRIKIKTADGRIMEGEIVED